MSSARARLGFVPTSYVARVSTMLFDALGAESFVRFMDPTAYTEESTCPGESGSWLISCAYGSMRSLLGLNRLPAAPMSATKPTAVPGSNAALYGQLGPHAR